MTSMVYEILESMPPAHSVVAFLTPAILLVLVLCGLTRLATTARFYLHPDQSEPPTLPYWIPYLGHVLDLAPGLQPYLTKQSRNHPSLPVFAFKIGSSKHNVLIAPSLVHQVLAKRENFSKISMRKMVYRTIEVVQGDYKQEMRDMSEETLFGPIHNVLVNMMREDFLHSALAGTVTAVETGMPALISGVSTVVDMERWERAAKVEINKTGDGPADFTARANLFELIRTFVVSIGTDVFMGREFLSNFPDFIDDFWTADAAFTQLMIGVPAWLPSMRRPIRARDRVHSAVLEHRVAHLKYLAGEDPGTKWGNMDDVSTIMRQRAEEWDKGGASAELAARGDTAVLMAVNVNAPILVFWMLWYIYQNPTLLQELRDEVAPYVVVPEQKSTGPVTEKASAKINLDGLWKKCPLLLGSFMETMRLESGGLTYKYVTEDFVVEESPSDARLFNKAHPDPQPRRYLLKKDEYICIPNGVHAHDTRYFAHSEVFDARRFWVADDRKAGEKDTTKQNVKVDFKTLKPFGGAKEMCKGRKFAEGEVLLFVAAFVTFWDMQPAEEEGWFVGLGEDMGGVLKMGGSAGADGVAGAAGKGNEGGNAKRVWKELGRKQGSGSSHPVKVGDCVVELKRRG